MDTDMELLLLSGSGSDTRTGKDTRGTCTGTGSHLEIILGVDGHGKHTDIDNDTDTAAHTIAVL